VLARNEMYVNFLCRDRFSVTEDPAAKVFPDAPVPEQSRLLAAAQICRKAAVLCCPARLARAVPALVSLLLLRHSERTSPANGAVVHLSQTNPLPNREERNHRNADRPFEKSVKRD
jgi:hypothetical protein